MASNTPDPFRPVQLDTANAQPPPRPSLLLRASSTKRKRTGPDAVLDEWSSPTRASAYYDSLQVLDPITSPTHAYPRVVYNGADWDGDVAMDGFDKRGDAEGTRREGGGGGGGGADRQSIAAGWFTFQTIGGVLGRVLDFCTAGAFRGFYAGGGTAYRITGGKVVEAPRNADGKVAGDDVENHDESDVFEEALAVHHDSPSSPRHQEWLPPGFHSRNTPTEQHHTEPEDMTDDEPRPAVKRRQVSGSNDEMRQWVIVPEQTATAEAEMGYGSGYGSGDGFDSGVSTGAGTTQPTSATRSRSRIVNPQLRSRSTVGSTQSALPRRQQPQPAAKSPQRATTSARPPTTSSQLPSSSQSLLPPHPIQPSQPQHHHARPPSQMSMHSVASSSSSRAPYQYHTPRASVAGASSLFGHSAASFAQTRSPERATSPLPPPTPAATSKIPMAAHSSIPRHKSISHMSAMARAPTPVSLAATGLASPFPTLHNSNPSQMPPHHLLPHGNAHRRNKSTASAATSRRPSVSEIFAPTPARAATAATTAPSKESYREQNSPHLTPEARRLARQRAREEDDADARMASMNSQLEEMIRLGNAALAARVNLEGDVWKDKD